MKKTLITVLALLMVLPLAAYGNAKESFYFTDVDENPNGNFAFRVKEGYSHGRIAAMEYTYSWMKANGTDAEIRVFQGLSHGFGLGEGTVADGWVDDAVKFWEKHMTG